MLVSIEVLLLAIVIAFVVGSRLVYWHEAKIWRLHACPKEYRTAICSGGKFYYVVPEREYVDMDLAALAARKGG